MTQRLRAAVIGGGHIGRHHARILASMPDVELVGIADPAAEGARLAALYSTSWYADHAEMLDRGSPHAVIIATPTDSHYQLTMETLAYGAAVLVEKPIAATNLEADQMTDAAQSAGRILTVGHVERFNPMIQRLREILASAVLGTVTAVTTRRVGGFPEREPRGDVVTDLAVHDLDILAHLLGEPLVLIGATGARTHHSSQLDSVQLLCAAAGASTIAEANWITPVKIRSVAITGADGYLEGNYITQELVWYEMERRRTQTDFADFVSRFGSPRQQLERVPRAEPLARQAAAFVDAVRTSDTARLVTAAEASAALRLAIQAREAASFLLDQ